MSPGTYFRPVLGDSTIGNSSEVEKVIFCSGKHYYDLHKLQQIKQKHKVAIIRLEVSYMEVKLFYFEKLNFSISQNSTLRSRNM